MGRFLIHTQILALRDKCMYYPMQKWRNFNKFDGTCRVNENRSTSVASSSWFVSAIQVSRIFSNDYHCFREMEKITTK